MVIPIPKPNKNKFEINNYRPISFTNTTSKVLEKNINKDSPGTWNRSTVSSNIYVT